MNPITANVLQRTIAEVIENFEPRARLVSVIASSQPDRNAYEVTISFYVAYQHTIYKLLLHNIYFLSRRGIIE
mgnify:CR=1 FL=1